MPRFTTRLLERVGKAMLDGADAKTVKAMFAEEGIELSEVDIAKVTPGIVRELSAELEGDQELSLDDLEHAAGGRGGRYRSSSCSH